MTKKDYILIASIINEFDFPYTDNVWKRFVRERLTSHFIRLLQRQNPLFDEDKFYKAAMKVIE